MTSEDSFVVQKEIKLNHVTDNSFRYDFNLEGKHQLLTTPAFKETSFRRDEKALCAPTSPTWWKQSTVLMPDLIVRGKGECKLHASRAISASVLMEVWGGGGWGWGWGGSGASDPQITSPPPLPFLPHHAPTICSSITIASNSPLPSVFHHSTQPI